MWKPNFPVGDTDSLCKFARPAASFTGLAGCLAISLETVTRDRQRIASFRMKGKRNSSEHPLGNNGQQKISWRGLYPTSEYFKSRSTYLFTNISKFCKEKIGFRLLLGIFPPSIRFWHEARRNSMNGFQRLKFALAHMLPRGTQRNNLKDWHQLLHTPSLRGDSTLRK